MVSCLLQIYKIVVHLLGCCHKGKCFWRQGDLEVMCRANSHYKSYMKHFHKRLWMNMVLAHKHKGWKDHISTDGTLPKQHKVFKPEEIYTCHSQLVIVTRPEQNTIVTWLFHQLRPISTIVTYELGWIPFCFLSILAYHHVGHAGHHPGVLMSGM